MMNTLDLMKWSEWLTMHTRDEEDVVRAAKRLAVLAPFILVYKNGEGYREYKGTKGATRQMISHLKLNGSEKTNIVRVWRYIRQYDLHELE